MDDPIMISRVVTSVVIRYSNQENRLLCTLRNVLVSIKLGNNNYMIWKHQMLKILRIFNLSIMLYKPPQQKLADGTMGVVYKKMEEIGCDPRMLAYVEYH